MTSFNIRRHARSLIERYLVDAGFRKKRGIFVVELSNDCLGWVGLPDAVREGTIAISPTIGIRHQSAQSLIARLTDRADDGIAPPTVSISLGFLLAERKWREWYFDRGDTPETFGEFTATLCQTAFDFFEKNANLSAIEALLENADYVRAQMEFFEKMPVIKYLRGDVAGAMQFVEQHAGLIEGRPNPRSEVYNNKFYPALIDLCEAQLRT